MKKIYKFLFELIFKKQQLLNLFKNDSNSLNRLDYYFSTKNNELNQYICDIENDLLKSVSITDNESEDPTYRLDYEVIKEVNVDGSIDILLVKKEKRIVKKKTIEFSFSKNVV